MTRERRRAVMDSRGEVNAPIAPRLGDTLIFGGLKGREALTTWGPIVNAGAGGLARILHAYAPQPPVTFLADTEPLSTAMTRIVKCHANLENPFTILDICLGGGPHNVLLKIWPQKQGCIGQ